MEERGKREGGIKLNLKKNKNFGSQLDSNMWRKRKERSGRDQTNFF